VLNVRSENGKGKEIMRFTGKPFRGEKYPGVRELPDSWRGVKKSTRYGRNSWKEEVGRGQLHIQRRFQKRLSGRPHLGSHASLTKRWKHAKGEKEPSSRQ